jgi:hypothetical protein
MHPLSWRSSSAGSGAAFGWIDINRVKKLLYNQLTLRSRRSATSVCEEQLLNQRAFWMQMHLARTEAF